MNLKSLICRVTLGILIVSSWTMVSCDSFKEDLPECRLSVKFKYDYNMEGNYIQSYSLKPLKSYKFAK